MNEKVDVNFNEESLVDYKYGFIGTQWDQGGLYVSGQRTGPESVRKAMQLAWGYVRENKIFDIESERIVDLSNMKIKDFGNIEDYKVTDFKYSNDKITENVENVLNQGYVPVVVGGDCSINYPVARAVHNSCNGNVGIIYLDAHVDLYSDWPQAGEYSHCHPCGNILKLPRVKGENVIHFGIRDYEKPGYYELIKKYGSHMMTPSKFYKMGVEKAAEKCLAILSKNTEKICVQLDIDVFEAAIAPGSGGPEVGGFNSFDLIQFLKILAPHVDSFTITEVNQNYDFNGHTAILAAKLFNDFIIYNYASKQR